jgi:Predicted membrane protein
MMLLVLCVDLDDDLGRKTGLQTPVIGRETIERAAVDLATADPEDSDVNVLFQGIHQYDKLSHDQAVDEDIAVAAVTGVDGGDVEANRVIGEEVDRVLAGLSTGENINTIVITDGAQDESILPVIRSRVPIDSVRRVVVRQAQDLESIYYTMKQVLADSETRGTILVPLGILLLIYPFVTIASLFDVPGAVVLGIISGLLGLYTLSRGLGIEDVLDDIVARTRDILYEGRVTFITYVAAIALIIVGGFRGYALLELVRKASPEITLVLGAAAFIHGSVQWFAAAGVTSSLGQVTDEYLSDRFRWRYLNAPFYVGAISIVLYVVSGFFLPQGAAAGQSFSLTQLAVGLTAGTLLGVFSTLDSLLLNLGFRRRRQAQTPREDETSIN